MKHIFIINPTAGKTDRRRSIYQMGEALRSNHGVDVEYILTKSHGHAEQIARQIAQKGEPVRFYACGGDGTINEVANGIVGSDNAAMSCIPIGTGNDFLKNFGMDISRFCDVENLWNGEVQKLDLIACNDRVCLTIACSGVDARIAESVHHVGQSPILTGKGSYLASAAYHFLLRGIAQHYTLTLDDETMEDDFALVSVCNGRHYGGSVMPMPYADMKDGILQTIVAKNVSRAQFAKLFPLYSKGQIEKIDESLLKVYTPERVVIQSEEEITTCLDGECFRSHEVHLSLSPHKLNFFGYAGCDPNATMRKREDPVAYF